LLNVAETRSRSGLSDTPNGDPFSTFAPLPSNGPAVEACNHFLVGMVTQLAFVGPSGWGKSHLLEALHAHSASSLLLDVNRAADAPGRLDGHKTLLLDNVQEVFGKPKLRQVLSLLLERRMKSGRPTVLAFTADRPTRQIKQLLPGSRGWTVAAISAPAPEEKVLIIEQLASAEGLALSSELKQIVARHMHVNGRTLSGALKRLRLSGENWTDSESTLRACGVLNPFFSDNPEWDLQHKIIMVAEDCSPCPEMQKDLALFAMMSVANLAETDVARWAGIEPSAAYGRTHEFKKKLDQCEDAGECLGKLVVKVVTSLTA
jgi:hypothetical protein